MQCPLQLQIDLVDFCKFFQFEFSLDAAVIFIVSRVAASVCSRSGKWMFLMSWMSVCLNVVLRIPLLEYNLNLSCVFSNTLHGSSFIPMPDLSSLAMLTPTVSPLT